MSASSYEPPEEDFEHSLPQFSPAKAFIAKGTGLAAVVEKASSQAVH